MLVRAIQAGACSEAAHDSPKKYLPSAVGAVASELLIAHGMQSVLPRPSLDF